MVQVQAQVTFYLTLFPLSTKSHKCKIAEHCTKTGGLIYRTSENKFSHSQCPIVCVHVTCPCHHVHLLKKNLTIYFHDISCRQIKVKGPATSEDFL